MVVGYRTFLVFQLQQFTIYPFAFGSCTFLDHIEVIAPCSMPRPPYDLCLLDCRQRLICVDLGNAALQFYIDVGAHGSCEFGA